MQTSTVGSISLSSSFHLVFIVLSSSSWQTKETGFHFPFIFASYHALLEGSVTSLLSIPNFGRDTHSEVSNEV